MAIALAYTLGYEVSTNERSPALKLPARSIFLVNELVQFGNILDLQILTVPFQSNPWGAKR